MISKGYVKRVDNGCGLYLYNYSDKAQYDKVWNEVTLNCRGLILDKDFNVIARPYKKFFNYNEFNEVESGFSGSVEVTDKVDGSLGILYKFKGKFSFATRGSFTSEQAIKALEIFNFRYLKNFKYNPEITYLFEIVYPENRIVVDYSGVEDLILLGGVYKESGKIISAKDLDWSGPKVTYFDYQTFDEVLNSPSRNGAEGYVIRFLDSDLMVKYKEEEYARIHWLISNISERRVWEALSMGENLTEIIDEAPDELYKFIKSCEESLKLRFSLYEVNLKNRYSGVLEKMPKVYTRAQFAEYINSANMEGYVRSAMFKLYDGASIDNIIWGVLRPIEHLSFMDFQKQDPK
jgi:RNA ligase